MNNSLDIFHPLIREWFGTRVGTPTAVQARAWPAIAAGRHVLVTAPTGSGKTLTAFLWGLNQLITRRWSAGSIRLLYVSPLKALNNDIQRNLLTPLEELRGVFEKAGEPFPDVNVMTRSGDTESAERQRMLRRPPEILITTPESLNFLLSSRRAQALFSGVATVILDEIHAVADTKRGTHLITAIERLVRLSGEFQRIAVSATVKPLEVIADFAAGFRSTKGADGATFEKRPMEIIAATTTKRYDITIDFPRDMRDLESEDALAPKPGENPLLPRVAAECKVRIRKNKSTLVFTNNRRHCETISLLINQDEIGAGKEMIAYSHHGSLSREVRATVEQRLKRGELKAIVATSSLELGIDIGALDEVVLVGTPLTVASGVQRVGRAGHQVGVTSRGVIYPLHGRDALDAAVMASAILEQDIEETRPLANPLDVLAQVIVSMTGIEKWNLDELYDFIRTSWPYHSLPRRSFDLVINMLAGRYRESRLRALQPMVMIDEIDKTITARDSALRLVYSSGGTIPDRGYLSLRRLDNRAKIGELDEEFVWERSIGDTFTLGMQSWKIAQVTHNDVLVEPVRPRASDVPFWRAEDLNRSFHLSERIGAFMESAEALLANGGDRELRRTLERDHCMTPPAADIAVDFLKRQRAATRSPLPHRRHVLVERYTDPTESDDAAFVILHTLWGGRVNRPLAFVLAQAWENECGQRLNVFCNNDCIVLMLPSEAANRDPFSFFNIGQIESLLRQKLEQTGFFGARFRENAARALLLPRPAFNRRMPLWMTRQRSQRLFEAVARYDDFPILVETWRMCMQDEFDIDNLRRLLRDIHSGAIAVTRVATKSPSPFAGSVIWRLTNYFLYLDDTPARTKPSRLSDELIREAVFSPELRPQIAKDLVRQFERKAQRLEEGYAPRSPEELIAWTKERLFLPADEWDALVKAMARDHGLKKKALTSAVIDRIVCVDVFRPDEQDDSVPPSSGSLLEGATVATPSDKLHPQANCRLRVARDGEKRKTEHPAGIAPIESIDRLMRAFNLAPEQFRITTLDGSDWTGPRPRAGVDSHDEDDPLTSWLSEWLRFYGPREADFIEAALPLDSARLLDAFETLLDERAIVVDHLTAPGDTLEVCDAENLEILLRLSRARARSTIEALPLSQLPLFLAHFQGLTARNQPTDAPPEERLQHAIEPLLGCPIPAGLLETDVLPARVRHYATQMLDALFNESDLMWFGEEGKRIVLAFSHARDLFASDNERTPEEEAAWEQAAAKLFADTRGQYYFTTLLDASRLTTADLAQALWQYVWQGRVTNDTFAALRKGIQSDFKAKEPVPQARVSRRVQFNAWKSARAYPGSWRLLAPPDAQDALDEEECNKDRVRVLMARYGVLFRELLARELPPLRWGALFRALRLMELSGELIAGHFFEGIPGLQFASPAAVSLLERPLPQSAIYWMNAADPASVCGLDLPDLKRLYSLPARAANAHVVFKGPGLMLVSRRNAKELALFAPPNDPDAGRYFDFMRNMLGRSFQPARKLAIEKINGVNAIESPYVDHLREAFDINADPKNVWVWKKTHGRTPTNTD